MTEAGTTTVNERRTFFDKLFSPIDIASLVFFRIAFGAIMLWEVQRYFAPKEAYLSTGERTTTNWIASHFILPKFHFKYWGFEWVHPLPGDGMYWVWGAMGVCAALIVIGLLYRAAAITFCVLFAYMFLIEQTRYLNHFYLALLVSFILIFVPAHRAFSVDALLRPSIRSRTAPAWALWWIRFQIGVVYFFGGVHKMNPDWLRGEPMRTWLRNRPDFPLIGQWFDQEWMVSFFVYGGIALDFLMVPALLWRWTRWPAFLAAVGFHVFNSQFFSIGIFPWFMIAATTMFFPPNWPRRVLGWLPFLRKQHEKSAPLDYRPTSVPGGVSERDIPQVVLDLVDVRIVQLYRVVPVELKDEKLVVATADPWNINNNRTLERLLERRIVVMPTTPYDISFALAKFYGIEDKSIGAKPTSAPVGGGLRFAQLAPLRKAFVVFLACYVFVQVTVPWRPYLYTGNMLWTEEGMWFSWNMMLSNKEADVVFELRDPRSGRVWQRYPEEYLTGFQRKVAVRRPEMILQLAHHIAEEARQEGYPEVEIYAKSLARINGRTPQVYLNPDLNLANVKPGFDTSKWIVPLKEKYPPKDAWRYEEITADQVEY